MEHWRGGCCPYFSPALWRSLLRLSSFPLLRQEHSAEAAVRTTSLPEFIDAIRGHRKIFAALWILSSSLLSEYTTSTVDRPLFLRIAPCDWVSIQPFSLAWRYSQKECTSRKPGLLQKSKRFVLPLKRFQIYHPFRNDIPEFWVGAATGPLECPAIFPPRVTSEIISPCKKLIFP
jgi:hypothetical protein